MNNPTDTTPADRSPAELYEEGQLWDEVVLSCIRNSYDVYAATAAADEVITARRRQRSVARLLAAREAQTALVPQP